MDRIEAYDALFKRFIVSGNHRDSDYFSVIRGLLAYREYDPELIDGKIRQVYELIEDEIRTTAGAPRSGISFGTSGWRGILGKDIFVQSVQCVTLAIIRLYTDLEAKPDLVPHLGVASLAEAQERGCLVGHDNRFGGEILARAAADILAANGFKVYYCGESTTGVLSAALLQLNGAFSINLTPSHNPLEYGGYKYNAADAGPAAAELTGLITAHAREEVDTQPVRTRIVTPAAAGNISEIDSFSLWQRLVRDNREVHGIDYDQLLGRAAEHADLDIVIDCVHGASRLHVERLLGPAAKRLELLRGTADCTFGGIAPEPSSANIQQVATRLRASSSILKIGAIIDPDADRIRFTDGEVEISMNEFGAMSYHFLHEIKGKRGMVAKTVATSNMANRVAQVLGEEVFETKVGFKEFKPVIGRALVCFEESDGISIIGHTPEKDAYIGLLLALDMVLAAGRNLGAIKRDLERRYGAYYPERDGVTVTVQGPALTESLKRLDRYREGERVRVGDDEKEIETVITVDGRKMIFTDGSWLMIRASGTEPKVRFYVESRTPDGTDNLVAAARNMLKEAGLLAS